MSPKRLTLRGGRIVDGTGVPGVVGNVSIDGDRIVAVGGSEELGEVVDVDGLVVAPGFVDIHSHIDLIAPLPEGSALLEANVLQGITTAAAGNCGISPAPLGQRFRRGAVERMLLVGLVTSQMGWNWRSVREFLDELERRGLPLNLCLFIGHSTLRASVLGELSRPATAGEMAEMRHLLDEGLQDGAIGLSIGLEYFPGRYAGPSEIVDLASVTRRRDGLVAVHTRGLSSLFTGAMNEAIDFARSSGCRLQLSHVNPMGRSNWDGLGALLDRVDSARAEGADIGLDMVTYTAWGLSVFDALPHTVQELGLDAVLAMTSDEQGRKTLRARIEAALPRWPPWVEGNVTRNILLEMGWSDLLVTDDRHPKRRLESIAQLARLRGADPFDVYFDLLSESLGNAGLISVGFAGDSEDERPLRRLIERTDTVPETDSYPLGSSGNVHLRMPAFHGTMARFLGRYSRELGLVTLEAAIHRMTQLPASRLRLPDRGVLRPGGFADIVVFDPDTIIDRDSALEPGRPVGIEHVFVNGGHVVRSRIYDPDLKAGRALRGRTIGDRSRRWAATSASR
jgi:N-acyl-D-aspartate/D-glutamate deacylase